MMKNYMTMGTFAKGRRHEGDSVGKVAASFTEDKVGQPPMSHGASSSLLTCAGLTPLSLFIKWTIQIESPSWGGFPSLSTC
jgi:hypothetical protein